MVITQGWVMATTDSSTNLPERIVASFLISIHKVFAASSNWPECVRKFQEDLGVDSHVKLEDY